MIVWQADPGFDTFGFQGAPKRDSKTLVETDANPDGFHDILSRLRDLTIAFEKPVVLVHGDSHYFIVDKPLLDAQGRRVENFTRVETFGDHTSRPRTAAGTRTTSTGSRCSSIRRAVTSSRSSRRSCRRTAWPSPTRSPSGSRRPPSPRAAASYLNASYSSSVSLSSSAARLSRRWLSESVPGIGRIAGERCSSQARRPATGSRRVARDLRAPACPPAGSTARRRSPRARSSRRRRPWPRSARL